MKIMYDKLLSNINSNDCLCLKDKSESIPYERVMNELPYLDQVLTESLRLYPPVVSFVTRQAAKDVQVFPTIKIILHSLLKD